MKLKGIALALCLSLRIASADAQTVDVFPNGCVIASVEFQANLNLAQRVNLSLTQHGIWSRIVKISFDNRSQGHAVVIFALQNDALVVYDVNSGTWRLGVIPRDISSISAALKLQYEHMTTAVFYD